MSLINKLKKNSTISETAVLTRSKIYGKKEFIPTDVPIINVALSGRVDGGLTPGLTILAGPSKHFKSAFALLLAKSFLEKYADGVILFYDSEFGTPESYFDSLDIDKERVVHTPITNVEELKQDLAKQLKELQRGEKVLFLVDSLGNLASKKEVEDAEEGKTVVDMTRAKQIKSLFRIVTPHLTIKDLPLVAIGHTYKEIGLFPKDIVGGGTGVTYSADNIWIIGREQEKEGTEVKGYNFNINIEKSRYVREKSKFKVNVTFEGGINRLSGLLDIAMEAGIIGQPLKGWYQAKDEKGEFVGDKWRLAALMANTAYWDDLIKNEKFTDFVSKRYALGTQNLLSPNSSMEITEETEEEDDDDN